MKTKLLAILRTFDMSVLKGKDLNSMPLKNHPPMEKSTDQNSELKFHFHQ